MENQEVVELLVRIATYQGEFDALKEATTDISPIVKLSETNKRVICATLKTVPAKEL